MERKAKNILVVNEIPEDLKNKYLGSGCSGDTYLNETGTQVFKELHNDMLDFYTMKEFTYFDSDTIAYPRTIVYKDKVDDKNIIGYLCDYVQGVEIKNIDDNENIMDIIHASDKLEKELKNSSDHGVLFSDINPGNVIYTKDKEFKLIDTDLYSYSPYEEQHLLYFSALKEWGNLLLTYYAGGFPYENENLNDYYIILARYGKVKPSYVLNYILNEINRISDREIQTLGEYKESQKLIKKLK